MTTPSESQNISALRTGVAGAAIGVAALVGGLVVLPAVAGAQDSVEPETTTEDGATPTERPNVLEELTAEGVITQEQADAIRERFAAHRAEFGGRHGHRGAGLREASAAVTELLGLTPAELREAFVAGQTLAEVAEAQGVSTEVLVDTIVAETQALVDEKLAAGDITAERAASILDGLEAKVEERVTAERPIREGGLRGHHRRHHHDGASSDDVDASLPTA
ncbi:MAG: hypothetical protein HKN03_02400 [Acidimicrobiales bacterium]|nr:hypothetical protein [Acidimicrobiales bacterium]